MENTGGEEIKAAVLKSEKRPKPSHTGGPPTFSRGKQNPFGQAQAPTFGRKTDETTHPKADKPDDWGFKKETSKPEYVPKKEEQKESTGPKLFTNSNTKKTTAFSTQKTKEQLEEEDKEIERLKQERIKLQAD